MSHDPAEQVVRIALLACAVVSIAGILLIAVFISAPGLPLIMRVGPLSFLSGTVWAPTSGKFGILPMIVGSMVVAAGCLFLAIPCGIACAIYLAEFAPEGFGRAVRLALGVLAGIPSVVYGFYGLVVIVPIIRETFGGSGLSVLAGSLVLAIMVLPTIATISEDAIKAVPDEYREGSMALGATRWETVSRVIVPAARSGITASIVLGMGRAIGETMALIMVTGNAPRFPAKITDMVRTLTGNVALEMGYAAGDHQKALLATGLVLLVFIMILNWIAVAVSKAGDRHEKA
ncbi:MAG: phosphate ABC transporter permease subunit PstC [Firmicutes bacterium]|nr:phosphate ABC transporter permease subunit PstC [Bacillota bacterium]